MINACLKPKTVPKEFLRLGWVASEETKNIFFSVLAKSKSFFIRFCLLTFAHANEPVPEFFNPFQYGQDKGDLSCEPVDQSNADRQ